MVGALVGLGAGAVAGFLAAIAQITAKGWRNDRLMARGEPGYKDVTLLPLWIPSGVIGGIGGAIVGGARWHVVALAAALPAAFALLAVGVSIAQSRR